MLSIFSWDCIKVAHGSHLPNSAFVFNWMPGLVKILLGGEGGPWSPCKFRGGGLWIFEIFMKNMEKREPALGAPSRWGVEKGLQGPPTPPNKSPRREVVRSSAGAGVVYPLFFLGSFA